LKGTAVKKRLRKLACLISLVALVGAGCLKEGANQIGMKKVAADLLYGVSPLSEVAAPPGAILQPSTGETLGELTLTFRPPSALPAFSGCPEAGPNDFPEEPAGIEVTTRPKEGRYLWYLKGSYRRPLDQFDLPVLGFADRVIEGVSEDPANPGNPKNFVFKTIERDPAAFETIVTQSWLVDQVNPTQQLRGLFLTEIVRTNTNDETTKVFRPIPPIMYFPLQDLRPGREWTSGGTGADTNDRGTPSQSLVHQGVVKERIRVDVCGEVVDSWFVEATQRHVAGTGQETRDVRFNYAIAPHFGALSIFEHITSPCVENAEGNCTRTPFFITYDRTIRQTEPDPPA
jgi:hypothetical protein